MRRLLSPLTGSALIETALAVPVFFFCFFGFLQLIQRALAKSAHETGALSLARRASGQGEAARDSRVTVRSLTTLAPPDPSRARRRVELIEVREPFEKSSFLADTVRAQMETP